MFVVIALALSAPAVAQNRRGLVWNNRPSIVFGEDINIDLKGRVQVDSRRFDPKIEEDEFDVRTLRVGLKGDLTRHFDWEIEREIEELFDVGTDERLIDIGAVEPRWRFADWKDVFINWSTFDVLRVKAGRFKMPFGLEQNTSVSDLDFAYRTLGSTKIAPGRDRGVMAYGELFDGSLAYEAGLFDDDGDNGVLEEPRFVLEGEDLENIGPSFAARVVGEIFRRLPVHDRLKGAEVGVAFTRSYVPEGLNSLRGEDLWGFDFFEPVYVKGHRQRIGVQWDWSPGPTGFRAEWMRSREQRLGQSNRNEDLSDFIGTAWYTSATWIVTGEDKDSDVTPNEPMFQGGLGLFEIGARFDRLTFKSAATTGTAFRNPRSDFQLPNTVSTITFGGNWLVNRWVKVVANAFRQSYDDVERAPLVLGSETFGPTVFWSGLLRLQLAF
ncbi:MAG TPA: porin [Vicinamibacterales bacterium]|nr:porin [Vicinamibacterales bacterium]